MSTSFAQFYPARQMEDEPVFMLTVSNEDEILYLDQVDESLYEAVCRHYESQGYSFSSEKL